MGSPRGGRIRLVRRFLRRRRLRRRRLRRRVVNKSTVDEAYTEEFHRNSTDAPCNPLRDWIKLLIRPELIIKPMFKPPQVSKPNSQCNLIKYAGHLFVGN